jgi:hypothetical protein
MAWVSAHEGMRDHPKTRDLSRKLECSRHEAIGILVTLWLWGLNNADRDGNILSATAEDIADGIMYRGQSVGQSIGQSAKNTAEYLLDSLISSGWIDVSDDGHFILHDWDVWQDQWYKVLEKRDKDAERKRQQRQSSTQDNGQSTGQSAGQSIGQSIGQSTGTSTTNRNRNRNLTVTNTLNNQEDELPSAEGSQSPVPFGEIMKLYNEICVSLPKIKNIDGQRRKAVAARWRTYKTIETFKELFQATEGSDFLKGSNDRNWNADFDWIMKPNNFSKVLEGKYANKKGGETSGAGNGISSFRPSTGFKKAGE